ncbi:MAG: BamA/TamA family outer membrane protein [Polyangiaceae bacterium]
MPEVPADQATVWDEPPGIESEDVGLFVPRVILAIPRAAVVVVFWPIRHALRFTERHALVDHVKHLFYEDPHPIDASESALDAAGATPTINHLSSQGLSVGLKVFHDNVGGHGEQASIEARFFGRYEQAYEARFDSDQLLGSHYWLQLLSRYDVQPQVMFAGLGDESPQLSDGKALGPRDGAVETRFRQSQLLLSGALGFAFGEPGGLVKLGGTAVLHNRQHAPAADGDGRSIEQVYDPSRLPGFDPDRAAKTVELGGTVVVDGRDARGATSNGVTLDLFGGAIPRFDRYTYGHFGGEVTGYIDLYRKTRVLLLRAAHEAVTYADEADIPFSEYPRLGGPTRLRGYALDRFRDTLTAATSIEYRYPIHEWIAGSLFVDAGRAAKDHRALFELDKWRLGGGGGFIVRTRTSVLFTVDVAYGDSLNVYFTTDPLRAFDARNDQL